MQRVKCAYVFCKVKRAGNLTVQSTVIVLAGSVIDMLDGSYVRSVARILSDVVGKKEPKRKKKKNGRKPSTHSGKKKQCTYIYYYSVVIKSIVCAGFFFPAIFSVRLYLYQYIVMCTRLSCHCLSIIHLEISCRKHIM